MEIHFCTFSSCFDYYAYFNTLMQFAGAVGTSVCAALVAAAQMQNNSFSHEQKKAAGSTHGFIFLQNIVYPL